MKHHRDHHATIFVSADVARPVEDIRRRWDEVMAAQIAAHVTLAYPREAPLAEVLAERLRAVGGTVRPVRLRLGDVAYFQQKRRTATRWKNASQRPVKT